MPAAVPRLIVGTPETCADLVYATGFFAPDPVVYFERAGRSTLLLNKLEIDRGKREARADEILPSEEFAAPLRKRLGREPKLAEWLTAFLKTRRTRRVLVPEFFPYGLARHLENDGIRADPAPDPFFPAREFKSPGEIAAITRACRITEAGMARGLEVLRASCITRGKKLQWGGAMLTSDILRAEIDSAVLRAGGLAQNTIAAGGLQACDPHGRGSGALFAGQLIILDIFPRATATGYHGDMTRTVVRGRASEPQRRLWDTVRRGQRLALRGIAPGKDGARAEERVRSFFIAEGYPTELRNNRWVGFFHGTGHGLGLEVHEVPRYGHTVFREGQVITVEPGLYYPEIGGVRIEDVALVRKNGARVLSRFPVELEI